MQLFVMSRSSAAHDGKADQLFALPSSAAAADQNFRDLQVPSSFPLGVAVTCS